MFKLIYIFIPLATLLLTACNAKSTPAPVLTSPPEPAPTGESTPVPTATFQQPSSPTPASPGEKASQPDADVLHVRAVLGEDGTWTFYVTIAHPDTGWEDYTDGWDVVTPDSTVLKLNPDDPFTRLLLHPHETEQPFTRSQSGITIPTGVTQVRVRAHDIVDGFGGQEILIDLEKDSGPGFEVER